MRGLLAMLIALGACAEQPSLRVDVTHDPLIAAAIESTTITVYQSELFTCEKVEFGDLSEEQLATGLISEIVVGDGELQMSRVDPKVIVARGFAAEGTLLAAGCGEKGVVGEHDSLAIDTHRVATVSVAGIGLEDADPFALVVAVTDPKIESIPDRVVSWRVHGSFGTAPFVEANIIAEPSSEWVPAVPACTNPDGIRRLHPMPPATIGGYAIDIRVSWSAEPPRRFTTLTPVNDSGHFADFRPAPGSLRWCTGRIANGKHRLVCLEDRGGPLAIDYTVTATGGGAVFSEDASAVTRENFSSLTFLPQEAPLQVFSVTRDANTRDAYMLTTKGRVVGLFGPSVPGANLPKLVATTERVIDAAVMQTCGASPATLLVHVEDAAAVIPFREVRVIAADGTGALAVYRSPRAALEDRLSINQTGCVAELRPNQPPIPRQVGVIDVLRRNGQIRSSTIAYFDCDAGTCDAPMVVPGAGVGFLAKDDPTTDPAADPLKRPERMVGATFDATGTVLSVTVLAPGLDGKPRPVELERITSAAFPSRLVTGRFDGDGQADLFWDIQNLNQATTNFQVTYAREVGGQRLGALSPTQQDMLVIDTQVADVTGDGIDDVIIMAVDALVPTKRQVRVIPSQAPIKADNLMADPSCGT